MQRYLFWLVPLLLLAAACGSNATPRPSAASVTPTFTPLREADCQHSSTATPGELPLAGGKTELIAQPPLQCGDAFDAYVDFSALGDTPGCRNVPVAVDPGAGRPCQLPLRAEPDFRTATYGTDVWRPVEGQDLVHVGCQLVGNPTLSEGTLRNSRGETSNIWDKVIDPRLPGSYGWANDLWLGNQGWRGVPCR